jgi:hypothetical protein
MKRAVARLSRHKPHNIDHIVPLKASIFVEGTRVHVASGLNVPANLRITEMSTNKLKGSIDWPDRWAYTTSDMLELKEMANAYTIPNS